VTLPPHYSGGAVYLLSKAPGMTSRAAAREVSSAWAVRKHGHAGTLDPDASGVLPVLLGRATRLSPYLTGHPKTYRFGLVLGVVTDTGDSAGRVLSTSDAGGIASEDVLRALEAFTGSFDQRVPEFSALHLGGVRAYEMARTGSPMEMPVRRASASGWVLRGFEGPVVDLQVTVSAGTYVRGLARDIGEALRVGAHATGIQRMAVGSFTLDRCSEAPDSPDSLLSAADAMAGFPSVSLDESQARDVGHGIALGSEVPGTIALLGPDGRLVAIGRGDGRYIQPVTVLEAAS
jgi:tRNA pseudouridine55 synthase